MAYTGRCWYCGSEDVEDYSDGSHECLECGMIWGGRQYNQQSAQHKTYRRTYTKQRYNRQWENSMPQYREKWRKTVGYRQGASCYNASVDGAERTDR